MCVSAGDGDTKCQVFGLDPSIFLGSHSLAICVRSVVSCSIAIVVDRIVLPILVLNVY